MPTVDAALRRHALATPQATALIFAGRRYSYAELDAAVDRASAALHRVGLHRGERLALLAENSDRFVVTLFAALRAGAVVVPLNPASAPRELDFFLANSDAAILAFDRSTAENPAHLHPPNLSGRARAVIDLASLLRGFEKAGGGAGNGAGDNGVNDAVNDASDDAEFSQAGHGAAAGYPGPGAFEDALILYTSGTTGTPKGALFDHQRIMAAAQAVIKACDMRAIDRILIAAPLSHAAALGVLLLPSVVAGAAAVLLPRFEAQQVLDTIAAERISVFFGVPTMYQLLLRETALATAGLASWRTALFGGSAMPVDAIEAMRRELPDLRLLQLCGQTEAGPGGIYSTPAQVAARPDASGHQGLPGTHIRIVTSDGDDVIPGETGHAEVIGEMLLRADSVMKGYWRDPGATADVLRDGWLHTGDVVRVDASGAMTVVDRLKDMIITGGRNVYSAEVERAIMTHPAVLDCAVIGEPHTVFGETVVAVVALRTGGHLTLAELQDHCRGHLARYKIPRRLLMRDIPRTATAKPDKAALRRETSAGIESGQRRGHAEAGN